MSQDNPIEIPNLDDIAESVINANGQTEVPEIPTSEGDLLDVVEIEPQKREIEKGPAYNVCPTVTLSKAILEEGKSTKKDEAGIVGFTTPAAKATQYYTDREIETKGLRTPTDYLAVAGFADSVEQGILDNVTTRDDANWRQGVTTPSGGTIGPARPQISLSNKGDQPFSGNEITTVIRSRLGIGSTIVMPLWHTGIHVTIKAPSDPDLYDLQQRIADENLEAARETGGLIFAINGGVMLGTFMDSILDHVIDSTLVDWDVVKLRDIIDYRDHQALAYGMALTIYPNGFNYVDPCLNDKVRCDYLFEGRINLGRAWLVDENALTDEQKEFMANRSKKHTIEEIKKYQETGKVGLTRELELKESGIKIIFQHPTLDRHILVSSTILNSLRDAATNILGLNVEPATLDNYINRKLDISELLRIANYVKEIHIDDKSTDALPHITSVLETLSSDADITKQILDIFREFTDSSMIALMAVPRMQCPSCQHTPDPAYEEHPEVVPQDAIARFFTLLGQKIQ